MMSEIIPPRRDDASAPPKLSPASSRPMAQPISAAAASRTVLQDSLEALFQPVSDALAGLGEPFAPMLPGWLKVGRAANEAAAEIKHINRDLPPGRRIKIGDELKRRYPASATEIARARRLTAEVKKKTPGAFPLPPASKQWPLALRWAAEEGIASPTCLREADQLLRDFNAAHLPDYAAWLGARARRSGNHVQRQSEHPATVYRRRWRYEAARATALKALADKLLRALGANGTNVTSLVEELGNIRHAWQRSLQTEPMLTDATDIAVLAEAEAALWAAQDAVERAPPEERLEAQRALGAAIEREGKRVFSEYDAPARGPWVIHVLGMKGDAIGQLVRLHRVWPQIQGALEAHGARQTDAAALTIEEALAMVAPPTSDGGKRRSDIFKSYLERHRESAQKGVSA